MKLSFIVCALFAITTVVTSAEKISVAETPVSGFQIKEHHREFWEGKYKNNLKYAQKDGKKIQLILLGDSITHFLQTPKNRSIMDEFKYCHPMNLGFSGDRTQHSIWLVEKSGIFDLVQPKLVVVLIGTNNHGGRDQFTPEETSRGIARIVSSLRKKCPETKILLFGIFPHGEKPTFYKRKYAADVNAEICKLADGKNVFYEDITKKFLREDGTLPKSLFPDFIHPSLEGYKIWFDTIRFYVNKYIPKEINQ